MLIPGALNSVQLAIIRRSMDFKKEFMSNLTSIVVSGLIGITFAYLGYGLLALLIQVLLQFYKAIVASGKLKRNNIFTVKGLYY